MRASFKHQAPPKHGAALLLHGSAGSFPDGFGAFSGTFGATLGCEVARGVSGGRCRAAAAVGPQPTAAGRRDLPAGLCAGAGGHRAQSSDAVSRFIPE